MSSRTPARNTHEREGGSNHCRAVQGGSVRCSAVRTGDVSAVHEREGSRNLSGAVQCVPDVV